MARPKQPRRTASFSIDVRGKTDEELSRMAHDLLVNLPRRQRTVAEMPPVRIRRPRST